MANSTLNAAKAAKNDEFYTRLYDIENELRYYKEHFRGKTVLCNCDDPRVSNFFKYFTLNFEHLGLKRLITTCYKNQNVDLFSQHDCEQAVYLIYDGDKNGNNIPDAEEIGIHPLKGDGDFRSKECIELLKQADIVVTNPPFSLFLEYVAQLIEYDKKFIIIGNKNALNTKEIFPYIQTNKFWVGYTPMNKDLLFDVPKIIEERFIQEGKAGSNYRIIDGKIYGRSPSIWFTNIDINKRHEDIILCKHYNPDNYIHYENYDAIEVGKVDDIPDDYYGIMGVPISFLDKHNPEQFEIVGSNSSTELCKELGVKPLGQDWVNRYRAAGGTGHNTANMVRIVYNDRNGKPKVAYSRLFIRRKQQNKE